MNCIYSSFYSKDLQFTLELYQFKKMHTEKTVQYNLKEHWKIMPMMSTQKTDKVRKSTGVSQGIRVTVHDD